MWAEDAEPSWRVVVLASAIEAGVILGKHFAEMEQPTELEGPWKVLHLAVCRRASRFPVARQSAVRALQPVAASTQASEEYGNQRNKSP